MLRSCTDGGGSETDIFTGFGDLVFLWWGEWAGELEKFTGFSGLPAGGRRGGLDGQVTGRIL